MSKATNADIAEKLTGALDKLQNVIDTLEANDDVEYENLETLTEPLISQIDDLADAVGADSDEE